MKNKIRIILLLLPVLFFFAACFPDGPGYEQCAINVNILGEGQVYPNLGNFPVNTIITFEIEPTNGWMFDRWEGQNKYEVLQNVDSWQITMNSNKNLTAVFKQLGGGAPKPGENYRLDISVQGEGTVLPNSASYNQGEVVKLTVRPANGWIFETWQGPNKDDVYGKDNNYSITMDGHKTLLAIFSEDNCNLDIVVIGKGRVEEKLMGTDYAKGSIVRLTAVPASGWKFTKWQGDATSDAEIVYVEIGKDTSVTAVFVQEEEKNLLYYLDLTIEGGGTVTKRPDKSYYEEGESVTLIAEAF